jgi:hypothetical protein
MIVVKPSMQFDISPQIVKIKVIGEQGYNLRVQVFSILWYDYSSGSPGNIFAAYIRQLFGGKLFDQTYSITSDPYEVSVLWRTFCPPWVEVVAMSITVEDSSGNVIEGITYVLAYDTKGSVITVSDKTEVWYIFTLSGQILHAVLYPGQQYVLPNHEAFLTIVWRRGYIAVYRGKAKIFEAAGGSAIFTLQFKLDPDTAKLFGNYIEAPDIASIVYKAPELAPWIGIVDYFRHALQSTRLTVIGVDASYDGSYYYVNVSVQADLMSPLDLQNILRIIAGIAAIIVGGVIAVKSLGVAMPVAAKLFTFGAGLVLSGIGLYMVATTPSTENPTGTQQAASIVTEQAIKKLETLKTTLKQVFAQLYQQGKISQDDYNRLVSYVENEVTDVQEYVKTLNKMVKSAYEEGKASMYPWIVVSFVGGVLGGMILERAAMPRIAPG